MTILFCVRVYMQITCEHKLACSWLPASELDHNFFLNLEFSTLSLLEIPLQKTTAKSKRLGTESQETAQSTIDVSVTKLKCLSGFGQFFFYFDDKSRDKHEISLLARKSTQ